MKKGLIRLLTLLIVLCFSVGTFTACGSDDPSSKTPPSGGGVKTISASLLDGKTANFMGADGFGIIDKDTQSVSKSGASLFSAQAYADENATESQKKAEFVKETEDGYVDVHFHDNRDGQKKSYKDLNKKYDKHHHKGAECPKTDCDEISDEITAEENSGEVDTVVSLDARVNKLYNYKNFTFMSVSSAVEGNVQVLFEVFSPTINEGLLQSLKMKYPTLVNIENQYHIDGGKWIFGHIRIKASGNKPAGIIPMKVSSNETGYHTANYWSDSYNQSYIIDNKTGITYSLSQFPYIYSVENGVIKVHDENAPGWFRYYEPVVTENGMEFKEKTLPTDPDFLVKLPKCGSSTSAMIDIYGNMVFNTRGLSNQVQVDEYGEKKYGNNVILAMTSKQVYDGLAQQYPGNVANLIQRRYSNANRYHLGSDGKIYRVDFRGLMSDVKVHVLGENATWQTVPNTTTVTFDGNSGYIGVQMGVDMSGIMDMYRITKISNGYAFYTTACSTDGGMVWGSPRLSNQMIEMGDFVGVTKIPVTGPDQNNSHLDFMETFEMNGVDVWQSYNIFLVGKTQMMYMDYQGVKVLDVETGETVNIDGVEKVNDGYLQQKPLRDNIVLKINEQIKYLNLLQEIDFNNVMASFGDERVKIGGELDAYFKLVKDL